MTVFQIREDMTDSKRKEPSRDEADVGEDANLAIQMKLKELRQGLFATRILKAAELKRTAQDLLDLGNNVSVVDE